MSGIAPAVERRLAELAERYDLTAAAHDALRTMLAVLADDEHAATTVRDPVVAVDRHVADGLSGLEMAAVREAERLIDIGTGIGVPALVLAAARPELQVVAMDTVGKKVDWVTACAARMGLTNVTGVHGRAEAWPEGLGGFDVVAARAVAPLGVLLEYAAPLLREGGSLVAWKGVLEPEEERTGRAVAPQLAMSAPESTPTRPWDDARDRRFVVSRKQGPTPAGFPRRAGMARKRPLG
ncbi:16S rRNA (guanine(527)-N(7))-methyltransferase RsmG [Patulibacter defluvii]|uniref:16S rRNA (guanine(527)-N(7))-methyltransferase RsmG n=1 Tax=Patulibacter defluvii TaxID=3095358 RepID=UPI002A760DB8|nr:16S rRNA (guanine(527)-N(7))-methyltransferase RsmG [Patulibacter sp. DM4]